MENENKMNDTFWQEAEKKHKRGKIMGGILIVIIGSLFLGRELGAEIPEWIFSWKTLLIAIGLIVGVKSNFKSFKWIILVMIGGAFLLCDFYPTLALKPVLWPVLVIIFGLMIIFKPRRRHSRFRERMYRRHHRYQHWGKQWDNKQWENKNWDEYKCGPAESVSDEKIDFTTFMGGVKKNIISKNFKGGEVSNVFGGTEINLSQCDFQGSIVLEISNVFGGTKLVVPPNWEIQSELVSVMGSIEDKRPIHPNTSQEPNKILILKGTVFMGGIDIVSY